MKRTQLLKVLIFLMLGTTYTLQLPMAYSSNRLDFESYCTKIHSLIQENTKKHRCLKHDFDSNLVENACEKYDCHHTEGCSVTAEDYQIQMKILSDSITNVEIKCLKQWGVIKLQP